MRVRTIAIVVGATLCLGLGAACAALPGSHRALFRDFFGLTEVAPGLWIDDLGRAEVARALARRADDATEAFFGPLETRPRRGSVQPHGVSTASGCAPSASPLATV